MPESHDPFGNCIPVGVNQVIKGIEISQWPFLYRPGNALARVHEPADLWDITFCTR